MSQEFIPWSCCDLTQYPLDKDWTDTFPMTKVSHLRHEFLVNATRTMFQQSEMSSTYAFFRNYAFQQGAMSNANVMDMDFFYSMLAHDYPFFLGHKGKEIQADFNFSDKKFEGLSLFRASHFDLFRVESAGFGLAVLQSMTNPGIQRGFVSLKERPKQGDYIFARLMPVGLMPRSFCTSVVEPWDTVDPKYIDDIVAEFRRQHEAFCAKFPDTSARAFMKICGYQFYELIQAHEFVPILNQRLKAVSDFVHAQTVTYTFAGSEKMPALTDIPGVKLVNDGSAEMPDLATVSICDDTYIQETLREAIVSREGRSIEVTMFMHDAGEKFLKTVLEPAFEKYQTTQKVHLLNRNETYRSLRHLSIDHGH